MTGYLFNLRVRINQRTNDFKQPLVITIAIDLPIVVAAGINAIRI